MRDLLGQRAFVRLWTAGVFAETGEWMLQIALPVFVYQATGSAGSTALAMAAGILPMVLLSPVAGVLADRWDRQRILWGVCLAQVVIAAPLLINGGHSLVLIYLVMAAQSALASLFEPARNALTPTLVGNERLTAANGLMGFNSSISRLAGSSLGGLVLGTSGLGWVVGSYLAALSMATVLLLPRFATPTRPVTPSPGRNPMLTAWLEGIAEFRRERRLRITGMTLALASLAQGMFLVLFVVFITGPLAGGDAEVGLLRGVQAIGGLVAGMVIATLGRRAAPATLMGTGTLVLGLVSGVIWNLPQFTTANWVYLALFAAVGAPAVFCTSGALTMVQTSVRPEYAGRVLATTFAGMAGFQTVGTLAAGALIGTWRLDPLLDLQAALLVTAGLIALIGLRRRTDRRRERSARATAATDHPRGVVTSYDRSL
ncbi:MFS transporter [Amycolatopsis cynarae]|uniref:MFS transporter n=1 Tax=Amycolatopsis cynarae TaxID=2995223 RepID=A0ABY7B6F6_9PSEU|nr:MFS transporter [Amycolatopsis sp. HUAS 11-8]WAL67915.1 MFS transporter [Amycolatopsis sp. HUAS 11-8]